MTNNIRLLVLDVDGTIAGVSNEVRQPVIEALQAVRDRGIAVAIATGRMYRSALRFHEAVGSQLPLIAYNGAWIQDPKTDKIHQQLQISSEDALELLDYFEQAELRSRISVHFYSQDRLYVREILDETQQYARRSGVEPIAVGDLRSILDYPLTKVLAMGSDPHLMLQISKTLQEKYSRDRLYLTQSTAMYFEATHPEVSKGAAVRFLTEEILGLEAQQVMAIGDNFNDAEMIAYAGIGVAMGNAPEPVRAMAKWTAPGVEEDGVAVALRRFLTPELVNS
ncbi:MAG: Cof-type HAD-IIB family hydrolase [Cyanobacteriota bacterium]|nr:Cof-type HAD-IIB family hydrolase [Cyanobacteriota bacterium]